MFEETGRKKMKLNALSGHEVECTGRAEYRKVEFLAGDEAYKAIFLPDPSLIERTLNTSSFSAENLNFCVRDTPSQLCIPELN